MRHGFPLAFALGLLAILARPAAAVPAAAPAGVRIVVPARDIARDQILQAGDLTYATVAGNALMAGTVTDIATVEGQQARRMLRAGRPITENDVRRPIVVNRGQTVTMVFEAPGVELTAMGRAISEGGIGDTVTVQNPASFRTISAVVTAPGTVRATGTASPLLARR